MRLTRERNSIPLILWVLAFWSPAGAQPIGPDLRITQTVGDPLSYGGQGSFAINVANIGAGPTTGPVYVVDTLPQELSFASSSGAGWACGPFFGPQFGVSSPYILCIYLSRLAAGASLPLLEIRVNVAPLQGIPRPLQNCVGLFSQGDASPDNNNSCIQATAARVPPRENFNAVIAREDARFEALRIQRGDAFLFSEESGYGDYKDWVGHWQTKLFPSGDFAMAYEAINRTPPPSLLVGPCTGWRELGPVDMPKPTNFQQPVCPPDVRSRGIGRINWITFDPADANNVFAGSPIAGLYYSTNAGATWQNGGTDFLLPNIGAAHLVVDPANSFHWFLASGDGTGIMDGRHDDGANRSHGVYRSLDKGLTWQKIGLDQFNLSGYQIHRLLIDPNDSNTIYAATSYGLYRTRNALTANPLDVTWSLAEPSGSGFYNIVFQPGSTSTIYASGATLVQSLDAGVTWNPVPAIPFSLATVSRMDIEVTPANPDYLYVVVAPKSGSLRLYRFNAISRIWVDKGSVNTSAGIGVSPVNASLIFIGNVQPIQKCTNGGDNLPCNWLNTTGTVHDDIREVKFTPDGRKIYAATDGGVYQTLDEGVTWTPQSKGLGIAKVLRMSTSATNPALIMGGHFDTGSMLYNRNAGTWTHSLCGDGLTPIIDPTDPTYMFASAQSGPMFRSDDQGFTFPNNVSLPCPNWFTFAILDPVITSTVFAACHPEVLRSTVRGGSWAPISNFLTAPPAPLLPLTSHEVWKMYTAHSSPNHLYAHLVGPDQILLYTNGANSANVNWTNIPLPPPKHWITDLDVDDETAPTNFWMTYGGYGSDKKVFYYDGSQYIDLTTNLDPAVAVNSIVHQLGTNKLFIGTTRGVYTGTYDRANSVLPDWTRVGDATAGELPYIDVNDVEINYVENKLRAGTNGRGTWEISLNACQPTACVVPPASITNWWPFDETAGTIAIDTKGGNDGEYAPSPASPTPVGGKVGKALSFDGNDYVTIDSSVDLTHGNFFCSGFTIDAWIKTRQDTGVVVILDKRTNPDAPAGYHLFLFQGRLGLQLADGKPAGSICGDETTSPCTNYVSPSTGFVADGSWHHIAATVQVHGSKTFCDEVGKLYVDGVERFSFVPRTHSQNSGNFPGSDIGNEAQLYIGRRDPTFGDPGFFNGLIDELEFFRSINVNGPRSFGALTQAEINAIFAAGSAGKCK